MIRVLPLWAARYSCSLTESLSSFSATLSQPLSSISAVLNQLSSSLYEWTIILLLCQAKWLVNLVVWTIILLLCQAKTIGILGVCSPSPAQHTLQYWSVISFSLNWGVMDVPRMNPTIQQTHICKEGGRKRDFPWTGTSWQPSLVRRERTRTRKL